MKLKFGKDANGEFTATVMTDKGSSTFSYITMLKALMNKETFETVFEDSILPEEKAQINAIIERIRIIAEPEKHKQADVNEQF